MQSHRQAAIRLNIRDHLKPVMQSWPEKKSGKLHKQNDPQRLLRIEMKNGRYQ